IGIHLHHQLVAVLQGPGETRHVCAAQTGLGAVVQHVHLPIVPGHALGPLAGSVRAGVVDHEHVRFRGAGACAAQRMRKDPALVIGRDDHQRLHEPAPTCEPASEGVAAGGEPGVWGGTCFSPGGSAGPGRRERRPVATPSSRASTASPVAMIIGQSPSLSAIVIVVRNGMSAAKYSWVNKSVSCRTVPSAAITPETPTVEICTVVRPCSTARSRDIASCCMDSAV